MDTQIRHPSLSSKAARAALDHLPATIYSGVFATIDNLASLYDGLAAVRANADPTKTREHNASAYKQKFEAAKEQARNVLQDRVAALVDYEAKVIADAHAKAGIDKRPPHADAIWQALRSMDQDARDAAVLDAVNRGDRVVMASIVHSPTPLLTGNFTVPIKTSVEHFLDTHTPELHEERENIETALTFLNNAAGAFKTSTEKMRDLAAEERAATGAVAAKKADAALEAAMKGAAPAPAD
ncbi:MAG: hypothetical protein JNL14_18680 [Devosia sp.]|uniref:hypothetical protein n=1 Tax=Devosia sp. TaxID=1871048 RepID=UPI001A60C479|nr:hypothetical protein [Devosia sp.]MBL8599765.1 hypothetical protein [Devosia sp.]